MFLSSDSGFSYARDFCHQQLFLLNPVYLKNRILVWLKLSGYSAECEIYRWGKYYIGIF
jgi:hypothetical protein